MKYMTYGQEMRAKHPNRPYITWSTDVLKAMITALKIAPAFNTVEDENRLHDAERELKFRRAGFGVRK